MLKRSGFNHKIRTAAFFVVWHLFVSDRKKLFGGHCPTSQNPVLLLFARYSDTCNGIHLCISTCFKQQRDVQNHNVGVALGNKIGTVTPHQWVNDLFDAFQRGLIVVDDLFQLFPRYRPIHNRIRKRVVHHLNRSTTACIQPMHSGIGIPYSASFIGKHPGGGGFAHPDRSRETQTKCHRNAAARVALSTTGRTPNQRSKPGMAWYSNIPKPSTVAQPAFSASSKSRVFKGA